MIRRARLQFALFSVLLGLATAVAAQQSPSTAPHSGPGAQGNVFVPGGYPVAPASANSLVDRLKAIRGRMTPPADTPESPEPASDGTEQPQPEAAETSGLATEAPQTPGLSSVLLRRSGEPGSVPTTSGMRALGSVGDGVPAAARQAPVIPAQSVGDELDSSRRTARRLQPAPTQRTPIMFTAPPRREVGDLGLRSQSPALVVETLGPKAIAVGKPADYRIRLENQSDRAAERVTVAVTLPEAVEVARAESRLGSVGRQATGTGQQRILWQADQVAARSQHELLITLQPQNGQAIDLQVDWAFRPDALSGTIEVQQPQLAIALAGPTEMRFGETRVFKVKLSNPGNGVAEQVVVNLSATGATMDPNPVGTLAAGETRELELELTARQAGLMNIRAVSTADGNLKAEAAHQVRVRRAQLAADVTAPGLLYAGSTATYQIRVTNQGDAVAENVVLEVVLPRSVKNGQGIDNKPLSSSSPRWRVGDLLPGTERRYTLQCDLTAEGPNPITVRLQATDDLTATGSAITQVEAIADLKLVVNDPKGPVPVGQDAAYEIQIVNRGSKEAQNVRIVAQFAEGIEPTSASGQPSEIVPGQVLFDPIQTVPAGGTVKLTVRAKATAGGNLRFRAELSCSQPDTKLVTEETTRFYARPGGSAPAVESNRSATGPTAAVPAMGPTPARR